MIVTRNHVAINLAVVDTDLLLLERAFLSGDHEKAARVLVAFGATPLLDQMDFGDAFDTWLSEHRARVERRLQAAIEQGLSALEQAGDAVLGMDVSRSRVAVIIAYLVFASVCFTIPLLTSTGWAEVLHVRELAIGAAAINMLSQFGAFIGPYGWGVARDVTGSFQAALIALSVVALMMSGLLLLLRRQGRRRAMRAATVAT